MWIADLLAHGLIRSSFVPPAAIQELGELRQALKHCAVGSPSTIAPCSRCIWM